MKLRVHLQRRTHRLDVDPAGIRRLVRWVLEGETVREGTVSVLLTGDEELQALNRLHRDRDRPTDVLSFPLHEPDESGLPYLGDVAISLDRARVQAPRYHHDVEAELARLLVHGVLHLLGYDHHSPAEGRTMKAAERRALAGFRRGMLIRRGRSVR